MNILLTGATGFVGKYLTQRLIQLNHNVTIVCRESSQLTEVQKNNCAQIYYDSKNPEKLSQDIAETQVDTVIHLATLFLSKHNIGDISKLIEANIVFGTHLLESIASKDIKSFINATTYATSVNGNGYDPQNLYTATKKSFEDLLYFYHVDKKFSVLNLALYDNYGPNDPRPKFINLLINAALKDETLNMSPGEQEICYTYVDDTVDGICKAIEMPKCNNWSNYSLYSPEHVTLLDLAKKVETAMQKTITLNPGFYPYRNREIMKFTPIYPILPGFDPKTDLIQGIKNIVKEANL